MSNDNGEHELAGTGNDSQEQGPTYIGANMGPGDSDGSGGDDTLVVAEPRTGVSRGTLILFAVLMIGAAGVYVMYRQTGPKQADAAVVKQTAAAKKTISSFLSGGDSNIKTMEALIKNTEKVVQQFLQYPSVRQVPLADLRTNPFREKTEAEKKASAASPDVSAAAEQKRREEERLAIFKSVQGLQLQSIMHSDTRTACMINNTLYREGQTLDGFTIEKISPAVVTVRNGSYRFELRMQK